MHLVIFALAALARLLWCQDSKGIQESPFNLINLETQHVLFLSSRCESGLWVVRCSRTLGNAFSKFLKGNHSTKLCK